MKLLNNLNYEKKEPFRDHKLFVIVCEGKKREVDYFHFFDGLSSNIKVHAYPPIDNQSAPNHVLSNAKLKFEKYDTEEIDELWLVLDVDHHKDLIHKVIKECNENGWHVAISNPCFEVWLFYHIEDKKLDEIPSSCNDWKAIVDRLVDGGFDSNKHPTLLRDAIENTKSNSTFDGYMPSVGSTSLFFLGEKIYPLVERVLSNYNP